MALFEIMVLDDDIREMIMQHASANLLRQGGPEAGDADAA
jgi:type II secretory ATPase GspE/PulE/Tfp pilus assembly ATPase PilB-like protein